MQNLLHICSDENFSAGPLNDGNDVQGKLCRAANRKECTLLQVVIHYSGNAQERQIFRYGTQVTPSVVENCLEIRVACEFLDSRLGWSLRMYQMISMLPVELQ